MSGWWWDLEGKGLASGTRRIGFAELEARARAANHVKWPVMSGLERDAAVDREMDKWLAEEPDAT